jgi:hypothetical protein
LKCYFLETLERSRVALDFHTEDRAFPGSQEKLGEIYRIER